MTCPSIDAVSVMGIGCTWTRREMVCSSSHLALSDGKKFLNWEQAIVQDSVEFLGANVIVFMRLEVLQVSLTYFLFQYHPSFGERQIAPLFARH